MILSCDSEISNGPRYVIIYCCQGCTCNAGIINSMKHKFICDCLPAVKFPPVDVKKNSSESCYSEIIFHGNVRKKQ